AARFALGSGYEPAACVARNTLMRDRDTRSSWLGVARIHAEFPKPDANAITGVVSNGTGPASNYIVTLTTRTLTPLGSGVTVVGNELWIVGGTKTNDHVDVDPAGRSRTGSTGLKVETTLNHVHTSTTYHQDFTALYIFLYGGNDKIDVAKTLTINITVNAG